MANSEKFDPISDAIYEAIHSPGYWPRALDLVSSALDCDIVGLVVWDELSNQLISKTANSDYASPGQLALPQLKEGDVGRSTIAALSEGSLIRCRDRSDAFVQHPQLYGSPLLPRDLRRTSVCVLSRAGGISVSIWLVKRPDHSFWDDASIEHAMQFIPRFQRALRMQMHVQQINCFLDGAEQVLDSLSVGIVVLNGTYRILYANGSADIILKSINAAAAPGSRFDLVDHQQGGGRGTRGRVTGRGSLRPDGRTIVFRRPGNHPPVVVRIAPFTRTPSFDGLVAAFESRWVAYMIDPERDVAAPIEFLRTYYSLTAREAELVRAFVQHADLQSAAQALNITSQTARTYLKHVFAKTGTSGQLELMQLVFGANHFGSFTTSDDFAQSRSSEPPSFPR